MPVVTITLDTSSADQEDIKDFIRGGEVVGATGLINLRWEDFSAIDLVRSVGLQGTVWQTSNDDTPGFLALTVRYSNLTVDELEARFEDRHEIGEYEIQKPFPSNPSRLNGNRRSPNSRN